MKNNIKIVDKCCGCFACGDVCPKSAIKYKKDKDGFLYPYIDETKCINCGKCLKVCPRLNSQKNKFEQKGFVCYSKNESIYNNSASGGIFSELARYVLENDGVVFGAAFVNLKVKHIRIDNLEELYKIQKSKYIQSDLRGIYLTCKKELKLNKLVLFSGTPCQVTALKNFLGREYDNLITCDLVCHGVPSQKIFDKYIAYENKMNKGKIIDFTFRCKLKKRSSTQTFRYVIKRDNGQTKAKIGNYYDSPYLMGFQKYIFLRESCYDCKYANIDRVGDITLGDFWNVADYYKKQKGISMCIVNSNKGMKFLNMIKDNIFLEELDIEFLKESNHCLNCATEKNANREEFLKLANKNFDLAVKKYLVPRRKIILDIYYFLPSFIKKIMKKIMKKDSLKKMW